MIDDIISRLYHGTWSGPDTESQKPRIAPGDRVYHNGEPVTVLHAGPARTHFIRGHHAWTAGYTRDLSWKEGDDQCLTLS